MSETWAADLESDAWDDSEDDFDSETDDAEDARSDAIRRARARRIALARRRMGAARVRRPSAAVTGPTTPRQTVAAIRSLDLETKVGEDSLRRAIERSNRRATRATYATLASVAVDQAFDSFGDELKAHDFVRAGARIAPLMLLSPERRRPGLEGVLLDPRVIGGAVVVGIVAADKLRNRDERVDRVTVQPRIISLNGGNQVSGTFSATALSRRGAKTDVTVTFDSADPTILKVDDRNSGKFTATQAGKTKVLVTGEGGISEFFDVTVTQ
ncbi:Ig-like domain-containing protein [Knoellia aerolata]|uniref:BIG2 domain-containing protein n=1 Tax=Knoellia aerolata DSM 18566 TaxID=1385519 RepID=A0A0A0JR67_9MICO|nr:Ig-like domain-containing protein [Knoellia aerolata]KGN39945.1 hypothetical protein N801_17720 [Knoellia aerolata DSM 18566]